MKNVESAKVKGLDLIRIALIGCGAITEKFYAPSIATLADAERISVEVVMDPEQARREALEAWFPRVLQITKLDALRPGIIDLAVVASPQRFHSEQSVTLLRRGVHVLCEKPMASSLQEAQKMVEVAQEANRLLAVGLFRRFFPSTEWVKEVVRRQSLGRALSFQWSEGGVFDWPAATPSFFKKAVSLGGVFADLGAHVLDLLLHWFGPVSDFDYKDDAMGGLEANADLRLRFENGVTGSVRLSRDTPIPNGVRIEFERGTIWFQGGSASEVTLQFKDISYAAKADLHEVHKTSAGLENPARAPGRTYAQSFTEQIRNVCRAIRGEEALLVSGVDALPGMTLMEQCYGQRRLMEMPWFSADEQSRAQSLSL
jgi:predicted dehydrogenase